MPSKKPTQSSTTNKGFSVGIYKHTTSPLHSPFLPNRERKPNLSLKIPLLSFLLSPISSRFTYIYLHIYVTIQIICISRIYRYLLRRIQLFGGFWFASYAGWSDSFKLETRWRHARRKQSIRPTLWFICGAEFRSARAASSRRRCCFFSQGRCFLFAIRCQI